MTRQAAPGRRDRRKAQTRQRLLDAALASFATRGYAATTMDQIAEDADVARSTVFNYFRRKEDLIFDGLAADVRATLADASAECRARGLDTAATLRAIVDRLACWYDADPQPRAALLRGALEAGGPLSSRWYDAAPLFADVIREGRARADVAPDVDPDLAGTVLFDVYAAALMRWAVDDRRGSLSSVLAPALSLYLTGVLAT